MGKFKKFKFYKINKSLRPRKLYMCDVKMDKKQINKSKCIILKNYFAKIDIYV